jgi:hypothetical protein
MDILSAVLALLAAVLLKPSVIVTVLVIGLIYAGSGIPFPKVRLALFAYLWPKIASAVDQLLNELSGKQLYIYLILVLLYILAPNIVVWAFLIYLIVRVLVTHLPEIVAELGKIFGKK